MAKTRIVAPLPTPPVVISSETHIRLNSSEVINYLIVTESIDSAEMGLGGWMEGWTDGEIEGWRDGEIEGSLLCVDWLVTKHSCCD